MQQKLTVIYNLQLFYSLLKILAKSTFKTPPPPKKFLRASHIFVRSYFNLEVKFAYNNITLNYMLNTVYIYLLFNILKVELYVTE